MKFIALVLFTCLAVGAKSQGPIIEAGGHYGQLLDIYPNFPPHGAHTGAVLQWRKERNTPWSKHYGRLETGLSLSWHQLGNPEILGDGVGLQYDFRLRQPLDRSLSLVEFFQMGGIYNTKDYDYIDNRSNIVTGSRFSFLISAGAGINWKVYKGFHLTAGGMFWHSSNGHTALPNVGMNSPTVFLSLGKTFGGTGNDSVKVFPDSASNSWSPFVVGSYGINEAGGTTRPTNGPRYSKYLLGLGISKRFGGIHRVLLSLEGYYNGAYRMWNESQETSHGHTEFVSASALMLLVGHEFLYGRFGLVVQGGYNLFNPTLHYFVHEVENSSALNKAKGRIPGRISLRYYAAHPWKHRSSPFVYLAIKSNLGQADFLEAGAGMHF